MMLGKIARGRLRNAQKTHVTRPKRVPHSKYPRFEYVSNDRALEKGFRTVETVPSSWRSTQTVSLRFDITLMNQRINSARLVKRASPNANFESTKRSRAYTSS